ncbi:MULTISPECIES: tRNA lysidine(34) synthetase TilS [Flavobacterium]|uniref:tRNA(Ile)-lysidine synthase n=1 Tax=Flavobacterium jumunjinense TaxID=998845 RepID=A0ABV5GK13_9FLAO|nr:MULTISPECIES: tRNA lysidine(34) synthetase TilS [Flavobacterium]
MLNKFKQHLKNDFSFLKNKSIFLAVSGGLDSMVMLHLFQQLEYDIAILHCNFQLRGKESDGDTDFVIDYAEQFNIAWVIGHFDTKAFAKDNKLSTQVAARELRYDWFLEQLEEKEFDFVATAHHADDDLETFIINLSRGTGIEGLVGIPETNEAIIRPLLPFSRIEIEDYAKQNNLKWREDSSNASDNYLRNKIRHHVVPQLKELSPTFLQSFIKTQDYLSQANSMMEDAAMIAYMNIATHNGDEIHFDIEAMKNIPRLEGYLHFWFKKYGFTAWKDILELLDAQTGKKVNSASHLLLKNRKVLVLSKIKIKKALEKVYSIKKDQENLKIPLNITFCNIGYITNSNNNIIFVDAEKLNYPLEIRKKREGDVFHPSGMNGKKKLSKYFKDEKYSLLEKEEQWLLISNNEIVWVIGKRADQRFLANEKTINTLKIELK